MIFSYSNRSPARGGSWETAPAPCGAAARTLEADVAVIGAGISGLAAAVRCAQKGLSVVVAEKSAADEPHGEYIGVVPAGTDRMRFAGEWLKASGSRVNEDLLRLYIDRSAARSRPSPARIPTRTPASAVTPGTTSCAAATPPAAR